MAESRDLLTQAWEQAYLDPLLALEIGHQVAKAGGPQATEGWLHVALAEARVGDASAAAAALARARDGYAATPDPHGLVWCDEVEAIALRRGGDCAGALRLHARVDASLRMQHDAMLRFVGHNSRGITAKLMGQPDTALRHFYAASEAAQRTGWAGPRIAALCNLGGYHHHLHNLEDARVLSEQGLAAAREAGARQTVVAAAANLITIYHAEGEPRRARAMAEFLVTHEDDFLPGALKRYALPLALGHLSTGEIDTALTYLEAAAVSGLADGDGMSMWGWLKARCLLARDDAAGARAVGEQVLVRRQARKPEEQPYDLLELHRVLADACEQVGDPAAALRYLREVQRRYEELVGRSARARYIALQVSHQMVQMQRELDLAQDTRRTVEDDRRRLTELNTALQAQIAETDMLHAKLREQALRDPLTGLHNRRYLFEMAPALLELARRHGKPLCVVLLDLDHFKLLNDTYGHHAGDLVLQRFAQLLMQMLRRSDVVCRHGGEEFVAVMPDIDGDGAQAMLARLLEAFQSQTIELGRRRLPSGSFSAGIALFPRHGHTLEQLLSRADRALYAAKHQGRARIELAPRTGFGTLT